MIKVFEEISVDEFDGWCGAEETLDKVRAAGKIDALDAVLEELYPDGIEKVRLNDLLRFEADWVFETLGINPEED